MRKLNKILIISLATFFLLAGNGVNLIEYCCNFCEDQGIVEALTIGCHEAETHSCCSDYSSDNTTKGCNMLADDDHKCHLTRYTLDDQEFSSKNSLQIITATVLPRFSLEAASSISTTKNFPSLGYVHHCGRCLLSHICVLMI